jgi:ADP-ribose pyrophosphatase
MKPEILSTETIYQGKIFDVFIANVREGKVKYQREIVSHARSAVVVPLFADKTVALVRQYRHAAREYLLELPAGTLEKEESAEKGARRELEEEIGVLAGNLEKLTEFYVSPGFLTEKMYVFLATDLTETSQKPEADEILTVEKLTFPEALSKIMHGEIQDAKTMLGLILAAAKSGFLFQS